MGTSQSMPCMKTLHQALEGKDLVDCITEATSDIQCNRFIVTYDKNASYDPEDLVVEEMHKTHGIYEYVGTRRDSANPNEKGPVFLPTPFIKEEACLIHNWGDGH